MGPSTYTISENVIFLIFEIFDNQNRYDFIIVRKSYFREHLIYYFTGSKGLSKYISSGFIGLWIRFETRGVRRGWPQSTSRLTPKLMRKYKQFLPRLAQFPIQIFSLKEKEIYNRCFIDPACRNKSYSCRQLVVGVVTVLWMNINIWGLAQRVPFIILYTTWNLCWSNYKFSFRKCSLTPIQM